MEYFEGMKTTIDIPDKTMQEAMKIYRRENQTRSRADGLGTVQSAQTAEKLNARVTWPVP